MVYFNEFAVESRPKILIEISWGGGGGGTGRGSVTLETFIFLMLMSETSVLLVPFYDDKTKFRTKYE